MDSVLSSKDIEKLKQYFSTLDANNTGKVSKSDAIMIVRALGIPGLDEEYNEVLRGMSASETALTVQDVINIAMSMKRSQTNEYQNLVQVFKMFDKNHDGTITLGDLHVLSHLGEAIPEEEIDSLIRAMGYGNVIPYEDLARALLRTD